MIVLFVIGSSRTICSLHFANKKCGANVHNLDLPIKLTVKEVLANIHAKTLTVFFFSIASLVSA